MGGSGSGRYGGRATVENGLTLDLPKLMRDQLFRPGCVWGGSLIWKIVSTGETVSSVSYEAHLGQETGRVRLRYTSALQGGERRKSDYWISLVTTPQPFGGLRWWFVCPLTGRKASKLYLPSEAFKFASRQAYGLAYRSQREAPHDRALQRAFKLCARLGSDGAIGDPIVKPKWMRWATFNDKLEQIAAVEDVVGAHSAGLLKKFEAFERKFSK